MRGNYRVVLQLLQRAARMNAAVFCPFNWQIDRNFMVWNIFIIKTAEIQYLRKILAS